MPNRNTPSLAAIFHNATVALYQFLEEHAKTGHRKKILDEWGATFLTSYRLGAYLLCCLALVYVCTCTSIRVSLCLLMREQVFHGGNVILSLVMIRRDNHCPKLGKSKEGGNDMETINSGTDAADAVLLRLESTFLPSPVDIAAFSNPQKLRVSTATALIHYGLLVTLTCSLDSALGLQTPNLRAIAYITVSVVLAPVHALRTQATIMQATLSLGDLTVRLPKTLSASRYRTLLLPTILHSGSQMAVLGSCLASLNSAGVSRCSFSPSQLLRVLIATGGTALALIPVSATVLTLVEADLLSRDEAAMVFQERGLVLPDDSSSGVPSIYIMPSFRALRSVSWTKLHSVALLYMKWAVILFVASGIAIC